MEHRAGLSSIGLRLEEMMKVFAILLLVAAVAYARPGGKGDKGGDNAEDEGMKVFFELVKLCMRLEKEMTVSDKRSWEDVLGKFAEVCMKVGAALESEIEDSDDKRSGPKSGDFDGPSPTGDPRPKKPEGPKGPKGRKGSGADDDDDDKRSGPFPTGDPRPQRPKGRKDSGADDDDDKRSGPFPTGDPRPQRPKGRKGSGADDDDDDKRSGPFPTGDPRPKPGQGGRRGDDDDDDDKRSAPKDGEKKPIPEELLNLCMKLAEMGEENSDKRSEAALVDALTGMADVCLAAFMELQASS